MRLGDETSALQLHRLLQSLGYKIHRRTILRCRSSLGWTFRGSTYCQMIREANKQKHLDWAQLNINETFDNVIWTDESSIRIESHRRFCCRKRENQSPGTPAYSTCTRVAISLQVHSFLSLRQKCTCGLELAKGEQLLFAFLKE